MKTPRHPGCALPFAVLVGFPPKPVEMNPDLNIGSIIPCGEAVILRIASSSEPKTPGQASSSAAAAPLPGQRRAKQAARGKIQAEIHAQEAFIASSTAANRASSSPRGFTAVGRAAAAAAANSAPTACRPAPSKPSTSRGGSKRPRDESQSQHSSSSLRAARLAALQARSPGSGHSVSAVSTGAAPAAQAIGTTQGPSTVENAAAVTADEDSLAAVMHADSAVARSVRLSSIPELMLSLAGAAVQPGDSADTTAGSISSRFFRDAYKRESAFAWERSRANQRLAAGFTGWFDIVPPTTPAAADTLVATAGSPAQDVEQGASSTSTQRQSMLQQMQVRFATSPSSRECEWLQESVDYIPEALLRTVLVSEHRGK